MSGSRHQSRAYHRAERRKSGEVDVWGLHPSWWALIQHCARKPHTVFDKLKVQDELPVSAEMAVEKLRFGSDSNLNGT